MTELPSRIGFFGRLVAVLASASLAAIAIGTLLTAVAGGKVGERFHRRVDRLVFERPATR